jgi:protein phosphatase PTC1
VLELCCVAVMLYPVLCVVVMSDSVPGRRALGDHALKPAGVSGAPHLTHLPLTSAHKYVIVGCDGLWDVMTDAEAVQAVAGMKNATEMADKLCKMAMARGTTDNVSVMAIRLQND